MNSIFDPKSSETSGYHLFFEPRGKVADELAEIIKKLSAEYASPVFSPHVTLLATIPEDDEKKLIAKAEILAAKLSPITLTLDELETKDAYYKALYIRIQEQELLKKYHELANKIFSMEDAREYTAHLSLLYGNYPSIQKEETTAKLSLPEEKSFLIDRVHVYKTPGEPKNWHKIAEFELSTG